MRDVCYCPKSNLIITGFRGYIGNSLIQKLLDDSMEQEFIYGGIEHFIAEASCVIHLGASVAPTLNALSSNLSSDIELLEIINEFKIPLVYASSNNIYPFKSYCEGSDYAISDCYSASKVFGEQIIEKFSKVPYVHLRIGDVFGANQKHGNFFKNIELAIQNNLPLKLYGNGLKVRSYVYIDEVCNMLLFFAKNVEILNGGKFNLCYDEDANLKSIIEYVAHMVNLKIEVSPYDLQKEINDYRTMKLNMPVPYSFKFSTLWSALDDYILKIKKGK